VPVEEGVGSNRINMLTTNKVSSSSEKSYGENKTGHRIEICGVRGSLHRRVRLGI
jgi:hypothetical protein